MVDQALIPEHVEAADPHEPGLVPYTYWSLKAGHLEAVNGGVIEETLITLYVNGQELVIDGGYISMPFAIYETNTVDWTTLNYYPKP